MSVSTSASPVSWPLKGPGAAFRFGRESASEAEWSVGWVLSRQGGWAPRQLLGLYAALSAGVLGLASLFWSQGAQVVMPLAWLQLLAVGGVLWLAWAHASDRECIELKGDRLTVDYANGSHVERVEFQPAWVRVEPEHGDRSLIELSGQGRRIAVGRFVPPAQRRQLAEELRLALRRWHQGGAKPASM